ncbi:MAG TPA: tRNA 4-thiouridine(8) synthase ThiI [Petrotoga sp.]|nr:MAG: putative tRNA sulfurtransferase [Petrotoga mobilis]HBT50697.1 tRNA 4-thiouridine(8) synthase ThiI [Petrotoga sp.]
MQVVVIRVDEIGLKNKNKMFFMNQLKNNIQNKISEHDIVKIFNNRIYLIPQGNREITEKDTDILKKIFGIHSFSIAEKTDLDIDLIKNKVYEVVKKYLEKNNDYKTFKISVNRADKSFPYNSQEFAGMIGEFTLNYFPQLKVDLNNPELNVEIDIRTEGTFIFSSRLEGPGGLPVGTSSRGTALLSGGIDSPVATLLMMRRGMLLNAVNFYSPPFTGPKSLSKILKIGSIVSEYTSFPFYLYVVPLTKIQLHFKEIKENKYSVVLQRRSMMRITNKISDITNTQVLVSGESLGQVASQTLENLLTISDSSQKVVLRPLIGYTKNETIKLSQKFGMYETSILPYEDSCSVFIPPKPATKSDINHIKSIENSLPHLRELEKEALDETKKYKIEDRKVSEIDHFES